MYQFIAQKHYNLFRAYAACFFMFMSATRYLNKVQRCSALFGYRKSNVSFHCIFKFYVMDVKSLQNILKKNFRILN